MTVVPSDNVYVKVIQSTGGKIAMGKSRSKEEVQLNITQNFSSFFRVNTFNFITKTSLLMLFRLIISLYCKTHMKQKYTL
jgi:hypothetical protein